MRNQNDLSAHQGITYTIGALRAVERTLLSDRQSDPALSSRLRLLDRKPIAWAKLRNEEWSPLMLLADGLRIDRNAPMDAR
jgi:hypothetical protein